MEQLTRPDLNWVIRHFVLDLSQVEKLAKLEVFADSAQSVLFDIEAEGEGIFNDGWADGNHRLADLRRYEIDDAAFVIRLINLYFTWFSLLEPRAELAALVFKYRYSKAVHIGDGALPQLTGGISEKSVEDPRESALNRMMYHHMIFPYVMAVCDVVLM